MGLHMDSDAVYLFLPEAWSRMKAIISLEMTQVSPAQFFQMALFWPNVEPSSMKLLAQQKQKLVPSSTMFR